VAGLVYALRVSRQHYNWPERDQRIVRWFERWRVPSTGRN
jgi:hypothetical protein